MKCSTINKQDLQATALQLAQEKRFAAQAKALSHPIRVRILSILTQLNEHDNCLNSDLVGELGLAQSTVSEHLRILKAADFIRAEAIPPKMCYRVQSKVIKQFTEQAVSLFNSN